MGTLAHIDSDWVAAYNNYVQIYNNYSVGNIPAYALSIGRAEQNMQTILNEIQDAPTYCY